MIDPDKRRGKKFCVGCGIQIGALPGAPVFDLGRIRCCAEGTALAEACFDCFTAVWHRDETVSKRILEKVNPVDRSFRL